MNAKPHQPEKPSGSSGINLKGVVFIILFGLGNILGLFLLDRKLGAISLETFLPQALDYILAVVVGEVVIVAVSGLVAFGVGMVSAGRQGQRMTEDSDSRGSLPPRAVFSPEDRELRTIEGIKDHLRADPIVVRLKGGVPPTDPSVSKSQRLLRVLILGLPPLIFLGIVTLVGTVHSFVWPRSFDLGLYGFLAVGVFPILLVSGIVSGNAYTLPEIVRLVKLHRGRYHDVVGPGDVVLSPFGFETAYGYVSVNFQRTLYVPMTWGIMGPSQQGGHGFTQWKLNVMLRYLVKDTEEDVRKSLLSVEEPEVALVDITSRMTSDWMRTHTYTDLLSDQTVDQLLRVQAQEGAVTDQVEAKVIPAPDLLSQALSSKAMDWGFEILEVGFTDIVPPQQLADVMNQAEAAEVLKSRSEIIAGAEQKMMQLNKKAIKDEFPDVRDEALILREAMRLRTLQTLQAMQGTTLSTIGLNRILGLPEGGESLES